MRVRHTLVGMAKKKTAKAKAAKSSKARTPAKKKTAKKKNLTVKRINEPRASKLTKTNSKAIRDRKAAMRAADEKLIDLRRQLADALDDAADQNADKKQAEVDDLDDAVEMGPGGVRSLSE